MTGIKLFVLGSTISGALAPLVLFYLQMREAGDVATELIRQTGSSQPALLVMFFAFLCLSGVVWLFIGYLEKRDERWSELTANSSRAIEESTQAIKENSNLIGRVLEHLDMKSK